MFDTVIVVDWSAGRAGPKRPRKDAIWACICRGGETEGPIYFRNRVVVEAWLQDVMDAERKANRRTLASFDFPFGYPRGFARHVIGRDDTLGLWEWLANRVTDDHQGINNRFEVASAINRLSSSPGPFWGKPSENAFPDIPYRKKGVVFSPFAERREADTAAKAASSCFQLFFNPTVGSQTLTGVPVLWRIRSRGDVAVWPLEDWSDSPIVLAEIWPGLIEPAVKESAGTIRDAVQVQLLACALSNLTPEELKPMLNDTPDSAIEEGWILGANHAELLISAARRSEDSLTPPKLKNDCFALPPGVDWTPVDEALGRLKERVSCVVGKEVRPLGKANGRVLAEDVHAPRANPPAANSAVDGYGMAHAATSVGDQALPLIEGRAAAGAPFVNKVPLGSAIRILTGAILPEGVDAVVLEEDVATDGGRIAFQGPIKSGANTRVAGEDVKAKETVVLAETRLGPPEIAILAATGVEEVSVRVPLRVGVLSTGDELVNPGESLDPARTFDANRPMLLSLINDWRMEPVDLGRAQDDRDALRQALDAAVSRCDVILTSGGASGGDEDHVSALLGEVGSLGDWRIALKPGRPLALGIWDGVPVFGLPGNPVAALVCTLIFARPAFGVLGGEGWKLPQGFMVPAGFTKKKKPGRREYLRARMVSDGSVEVFHSEGSGRISGLAWADGLVELPDGAMEVTPGTPVRYIPYASFR